MNPLFEVLREPHSMVTQFISAEQATKLGQPITNLIDDHSRITDAVDFLLHGY